MRAVFRMQAVTTADGKAHVRASNFQPDPRNHAPPPCARPTVSPCCALEQKTGPPGGVPPCGGVKIGKLRGVSPRLSGVPLALSWRVRSLSRLVSARRVLVGRGALSGLCQLKRPVKFLGLLAG